MGNIAAFLQPPVMGEEKKVWISRRFKGEDGKPLPFVIRVIDQETNAKLLKQATRKNRVNGQMVQEMDADRYGIPRCAPIIRLRILWKYRGGCSRRVSTTAWWVRSGNSMSWWSPMRSWRLWRKQQKTSGGEYPGFQAVPVHAL